MRKTLIKLTLIFPFMLGVSTYAVNAQSLATGASPAPSSIAASTQDDDLKSQQQLVAELKKLRAENQGLKDEVSAQKGTIEVQMRIIKIVEERGDFFKVAAEKGIKTGENCGLIQEKYDRIVAQYEAEENRLRSENDKLRSSRNTRALIGFGAGLGIGYLGARH